MRLVDEQGNEVPRGELGEVVGRSVAMMTAYHGQPGKTREAEWYDAQGNRFIRTGDVGRFDDDGFLVLMDRRKDMVISGGFNIYPSDLEAVLRQHPAVADAAVVGVPSAEWGESPVAYVVPRDDAPRPGGPAAVGQRAPGQDAAPGRPALHRRAAAQRHRQGAQAAVAGGVVMQTDTGDQRARQAARGRARLWPALRARPRLLACMLIGIAAYALGAWLLPLPKAAVVLLAWNVASLLFLALSWHQMRHVPVDVLRTRSVGQHEGRMMILLLVVAGAAALLLAVGSELVHVKDMKDGARGAHLALALLTIVTSWVFTQVLFALHYAHDFYMARHSGRPDPLEFPGTRDPDYGDFVYFSCIIGTSAQTADVNFTDSALRRIGTLHCVLSFFFNTTLLALTINVAAGLLQ